ncbi:MAG: CDP-archaeol synthase [Candidatus Poribacteria bacterium]|jgi:phosphatidate cytidylyltransferase|nr:CDP-archaeol synthase [Candidatus Poribacteria bacterium]MDP6747372.1 CDP-archaeol synthase [Candidatus Poribacteria bacterium]MDP6995655.1 CDP-archaeol synthase [Candidatus Poribacteria bacterium]
MLLRLLSALVLIPLVILVIWQGGALYLLMVVALVAVMLFELCRLTEEIGSDRSRFLTILSGLFLCLVALTEYLPQHSHLRHLSFGPVLFATFLLNFTHQIFHDRTKFLSVATNFVNAIYIGWGFGFHALKLRQLSGSSPRIGFYLIVFLLATIWCNDTFAYLFGKQFGQYKLRPNISPGKTIEGTLAGLIGGTISALMIWRFLFKQYLIGMEALSTTIHVVCAAQLIGITSQLGDLSESIIKRDAGVKDSGYLIPGHGGFLDRLDSIIFATPAFFYYLEFTQLL